RVRSVSVSMWQHRHAGLGLFSQHVTKCTRGSLVGHERLEPEKAACRSVSAHDAWGESAELCAKARRQLLPLAGRGVLAGERAELHTEAGIGSPRAGERGGGLGGGC